MKFVYFIITLGCFAIHANIPSDLETLIETCISVNLTNLKNPYLSPRGKARSDGLWQVPLSPEHLAQKINAHLSDPNLHAKVYSSRKPPDSAELKAILKSSSMIFAYEYREDAFHISTQIITYKQPKKLKIKTFKKNLDIQPILSLIKSTLTNNLIHDNLITEINKIGTFPEESYFDNWERYSFVYLTKKRS